VLSTVQQADNALGVALLGIVSYGRPAVVPHAFRGCLIFLIVVELALAALVQLLPDLAATIRRLRSESVAPQAVRLT